MKIRASIGPDILRRYMIRTKSYVCSNYYDGDFLFVTDHKCVAQTWADMGFLVEDWDTNEYVRPNETN